MIVRIFGIVIDISTRKQRAACRDRISHKTLLAPDREASHAFWDSFCGGGTIVAQCGCGRTHFVSDTDMDYDEGELEELRAKAEKEPDRYFEDADNSSVSVLDMPDGLIVWGCKCHKAARYERFLVDYRDQIMEFYRRLIDMKARALQHERKQLEITTKADAGQMTL